MMTLTQIGQGEKGPKISAKISGLNDQPHMWYDYLHKKAISYD